ncbi:DUF5134 domain-containing protein [Streptomyces sp. ICBB 8177]|uniref:DUF5134 domain-containing protein n=1 Tax=Streptomyces sp. ICBB 8177 TaxID=563922 RepID=UPI000D67EF5A|nr:DUF5134 domain-containing protein [Streptomyces sp. ICBB 8177]PWI41720.1 DUF5134 domain-containing protein [Streptomyces sp. ICBB 8177]
MGGPPLVGWLVVLLGAATGISCLLRSRRAYASASGERQVARAEGVKGLGMALMALPAPALDQRPWGPPLFTAVFGAMTLWSLSLLIREHHPAHHVHLAVGSAAMVYMAVAMGLTPSGAGSAGTSGMAGMTGMDGGSLGVPVLTGVLLVYFGLYAVWAALRMLPAVGAAPAGSGAVGGSGSAVVTGGVPGAVLRAPELAAACRVSLGIGMFAMLLTM